MSTLDQALDDLDGRHERDVAVDRVAREVAVVAPVEPDRTLRGVVHAPQELQQRRLAGAARQHHRRPVMAGL